ncbi:iron ABC transporter permease [Thermococcus chitonophagus]|uniref:Iron ABC transporter permease n=1 Tax=Thermococcus chitonophagus TaxID=54262 RepID=A0A161KF83_9EURY|nr:iron ABC transporter permease [Thermococcus chitonophagus]ASJ16110.1 iron ABC transporter permease [Thermococcus chitonophagus]CUX78922.1 Iron(III) dicitrate transport system permease protein FecD (TC 3.A.1.14.1) [Thermococcus chitonophagus]
MEVVYKGIIIRRIQLLTLFLFACLLSFLLDLSIGPAFLSPKDVLLGVLMPNSVDNVTRVIIWDIRLPIAITALLVGASLGIAGVEMQTILNNPLASPYTLGISAGAGFGAALAILLGANIVFVPISAFIFAMLSSLLIYSIAKIKGASTEIMVLAGIGIVFLFNSALAFIEYLASEETLQAIVFWLFGSLLKASWTKAGIIFLGFLPTFLILIKNAWQLTAMRLGDDGAKSLGINVEELRLKVLILISILTAVAVCFVGTIGFVGLVGPHIARMLIGEDQRFLIPASALSGAFILSFASVISKSVVPGAVLPIGIITSMIGVPFFMFLVMRKRREFW